MILEDSEMLGLSNIPVEVQNNDGRDGKTPFHLSEVEKRHITRVLEHTKGNKSEAARLMNIGLATLYRKIDEYGLK